MVEPRGKIDPERRYTGEQVAVLVFGKRREWFYRNRPRLQEQEGFPPPICAIGSPLWQGSVLIAWLERHSRAPAAIPANVNRPEAAPEAHWEHLLHSRLAGLPAE